MNWFIISILGLIGLLFVAIAAIYDTLKNFNKRLDRLEKDHYPGGK